MRCEVCADYQEYDDAKTHHKKHQPRIGQDSLARPDNHVNIIFLIGHDRFSGKENLIAQCRARVAHEQWVNSPTFTISVHSARSEDEIFVLMLAPGLGRSGVNPRIPDRLSAPASRASYEDSARQRPLRRAPADGLEYAAHEP